MKSFEILEKHGVFCYLQIYLLEIFISVFNLGEYRRHKTTAYKNHEFFRPDNEQAMALRAQCALEALQDVCRWLNNGGEVAVFDATNSTLERRKVIQDYVVNKMGFKLFFVESVSHDIMCVKTLFLNFTF